MNTNTRIARILALGCTFAAAALAAPTAAAETHELDNAKALAAPSHGIDNVTVADVIAKWTPSLMQGFGWSTEGVADLQARLSRLPASALKDVARQTTWTGLTSALAGAERAALASGQGPAANDLDPAVAHAKSLAQKVLGDENRDLTFIPTKPCRIFDTRFESSGNPYAGRYTGANTKYFWAFNFLGTGDFSAYGGNTGCIENVQANATTLNGTAPYAVMIKLTIVGPAGPGSYVSAVRSGDANPAPNLVSAYCDLAGGAPCFATVVVPVCRGTTGCAGIRDLAILSNMALDLAGEVQGYFLKPEATPLDCTSTYFSPASASWANATYASVYPTSCPAGYVTTGMTCGYNGNAPSGVYLQESGSFGYCQWLNISGGALNVSSLEAQSRCCRTPGR